MRRKRSTSQAWRRHVITVVMTTQPSRQVLPEVCGLHVLQRQDPRTFNDNELCGSQCRTPAVGGTLKILAKLKGTSLSDNLLGLRPPFSGGFLPYLPSWGPPLDPAEGLAPRPANPFLCFQTHRCATVTSLIL